MKWGINTVVEKKINLSKFPQSKINNLKKISVESVAIRLRSSSFSEMEFGVSKQVS